MSAPNSSATGSSKPSRSDHIGSTTVQQANTIRDTADATKNIRPGPSQSEPPAGPSKRHSTRILASKKTMPAPKDATSLCKFLDKQLLESNEELERTKPLQVQFSDRMKRIQEVENLKNAIARLKRRIKEASRLVKERHKASMEKDVTLPEEEYTRLKEEYTKLKEDVDSVFS